MPDALAHQTLIAELSKQLRPVRTLRPKRYDVAVIAVAHREFRALGAPGVRRLCKKNHVVYDIKHLFPAAAVDGRL